MTKQNKSLHGNDAQSEWTKSETTKMASKGVAFDAFAKTDSGTARLACSKCSKMVSNITALKRHMRIKHSVVSYRYFCEICRKSYCRRDVAIQHILKMHDSADVEINISKEVYDPKLSAEKPKIWIPPPEAQRVNQRYNNEDDSENTIMSCSNETICQDELPSLLWNRQVYIYSVYGMFQ